jgi:glycosyltransferase involved in cell wall biosynthesis
MHILFSYGLPGRGGDAVQVQALAEALQTAGHAVDLIGLAPVRPYDVSSLGARLRSGIRRLPWWARDLAEIGLSLRTAATARLLRRRGPFDLILHRATIYDSAGLWLGRDVRCPLVVHLDAPFAVERTFRGDGYFASLHRRCMRLLGRRAQLIVTVSEASREYYRGLGLPEGKMRVLTNGISDRLVQKGAALARAHPPLADPETSTVGFAGSLSRWHRVDLLLEACRRLMSRGKGDIRLAVIGSGEEDARVRALERQWGLVGRVRWLGPMAHDRAFEEMARFDVAVLPHTLHTGAPLKLFEYAALGRPTIAPDLPNLRALFTEDDMLFVPPEDPDALARAIVTLRRDPAAARRRGRRAAARVRQHTWERWVTEIVQAVGAEEPRDGAAA